VRFTSVFGYYIEITNTHRERIPDHYIRKQTLKNCERYITPELKEYEAKVLSADESSQSREYELFLELRECVHRSTAQLQTNAAIMPSFIYKKQANFDQLDVGTYFLYEPVIAGVWYRGIPIQQNVADRVNQDAVVVLLGFQMQKLELVYSYDFTVSSLGPIAGGAHELSVKYRLETEARSKTRKREKFIPCPTFMKD